MDILTLWLSLASFSFGILGFNFIYSKMASGRPWRIRRDGNYRPRVSIIVPTYNEGETIRYKLRNLVRLEYPNELMEVVLIDSRSTDSTVEEITKFILEHPKPDIRIIEESERKGKSSALNTALRHCTGDVIVVSDADCFWPVDILSRTLPYMADPTVGAISGPKKLLNAKKSWVTKSEERYLRSMNLMKLGESKRSSTLFSEGGFSAYKRTILERFDPYDTGSDDCGTVIRILEKNLRAIMVWEGEFFTSFPESLQGKTEIKIRRANQILRVFRKYAHLIFRNKIKSARGVVSRNLVLYLVAPVVFLFFLLTTFLLFLQTPIAVLLLLLFAVPRVRGYLIEATMNYLLLLYSMISIAFDTRFYVWNQPQDRTLVTEDLLLQQGLV